MSFKKNRAKMIYKYSRNSKKGKCLNSFKTILIKSNGKVCSVCGRNARCRSSLEVDHIIPIAAGGDEFEINNMRLVCIRCHNKKTGDDSLIINILKKLKIIQRISLCQWESTIPLPDLRDLYKQLLSLYEHSCWEEFN